jgi:hypothetical protein
MKNLLTSTILFFGLIFIANSQPTNITWQGKLLDADGNAITQNNVAMTFAIYNASTGGNQLWPASGAVVKYVNVLNGLYSVQLGTGFDDDIAFTAAMFDGKTPWLEVKVGTETLPRTPVTNVPFALISNELSASGWENPGEIGKITPTTGTFTSVETGNIKVTNGAAEGKVLTSDAEGNASWETSQGQTPGTELGEMQYWNGTEWATVAAGKNGQILKYIDGVPTWSDENINTLAIGDFYQGGIIAYFLQDGDDGYDPNIRHGLIAAPTDQSTGAEWGCAGTTIGTMTELGTGAHNTSLIVAGCSEDNIAAKICSDLELNGYADWYLPSKDELNKLYENREIIGGFADGDDAVYWSSSEHDIHTNNAWIYDFGDNLQTFNGKAVSNRVRAVRAFWSDDNTLSIGDFYQGGIIAYFLLEGDPGYDPNVRHGLIAAPTDQSTGAQWGCAGTTIGTMTELGTGAHNTSLIVAGCSEDNIAAKICSDLELNGYADWYLPSKDELNKLYENREIIGGFADGNDAVYWSSSEDTANTAWAHDFEVNNQGFNGKAVPNRVRAVRDF